jgi:hypothetical protein
MQKVELHTLDNIQTLGNDHLNSEITVLQRKTSYGNTRRAIQISARFGLAISSSSEIRIIPFQETDYGRSG